MAQIHILDRCGFAPVELLAQCGEILIVENRLALPGNLLGSGSHDLRIQPDAEVSVLDRPGRSDQRNRQIVHFGVADFRFTESDADRFSLKLLHGDLLQAVLQFLQRRLRVIRVLEMVDDGNSGGALAGGERIDVIDPFAAERRQQLFLNVDAHGL